MPKPLVFISYSHKDKDWVTNYLVAKLEQHGIACHIDHRDFEIGTAALINMEQAVEKCAKTILVFTPDWVQSEFTNFEGLMLQTDDPAGLKKRIFPIMLRDCEPPKRLRIFTYADFRDEASHDTEMDRVIKQLQRDLDLTPTPRTYPELPGKNIDIARLPETGFELFGRHEELTLLNNAWESDTTNVVCFVAYGGVGKSTLVNKWAEKMRWDNYRGAERVYAWSFYSQGTNDRVTSADLFIRTALEWFGDPEPDQGSAWDKGKRLARLINKQKTLLILDGLEPLQAAETVEKGKIKDPALSTLIIELARSNQGLCVITTREYVPQLDRYKTKIKQQNLELISDEAGRKLLETRRIIGTDDELEQLVRQFGNHALAINLLAEYLRIFENHPLENAKNVPDLDIPVEQGKHARRVIEALTVHFGDQSAEYQLLCILGLFDRPVPIGAVRAISGGEPIPGLSDKLSDTNWRACLKTLRKHKLLFKESEHDPDTLDCHPLIREHFGEKLKQQNPDAWKAAHARLYEYYKNLPEKELPDTLEEMEPLFAAVRHGCLAGKYQEALDEVFFERVYRKNKKYLIHILGAISADISCLSNFFDTVWTEPIRGLPESAQAACLSWAGFGLRALGRLSDAAQPMKTGLEMYIRSKKWSYSATAASNLSQLYLTLGNLASAQEYGAKCVSFADLSGESFQMESRRATHADVLHQTGKTKAAEKLFLEAEEMQKRNQPDFPWLYSYRGFKFCDLLLSMGKYLEALERAHTTVQYKSDGWYPLLSFALDQLTIGKALILQSLENNVFPFSNALVVDYFIEAEYYINQAVDGLRAAGQQDDLPRGLLTRAALYRHQHNFLHAWTDLDEVLEIASYGQMRLFLTDHHLEACRLIQAQLASTEAVEAVFEIIENGETLQLSRAEMQARFQEHFREAERLVEETGYHRRDGEVEELREGV